MIENKKKISFATLKESGEDLFYHYTDKYEEVFKKGYDEYNYKSDFIIRYGLYDIKVNEEGRFLKSKISNFVPDDISTAIHRKFYGKISQTSLYYAGNFGDKKFNAYVEYDNDALQPRFLERKLSLEYGYPVLINSSNVHFFVRYGNCIINDFQFYDIGKEGKKEGDCQFDFINEDEFVDKDEIIKNINILKNKCKKKPFRDGSNHCSFNSIVILLGLNGIFINGEIYFRNFFVAIILFLMDVVDNNKLNELLNNENQIKNYWNANLLNLKNNFIGETKEMVNNQLISFMKNVNKCRKKNNTKFLFDIKDNVEKNIIEITTVFMNFLRSKSSYDLLNTCFTDYEVWTENELKKFDKNFMLNIDYTFKKENGKFTLEAINNKEIKLSENQLQFLYHKFIDEIMYENFIVSFFYELAKQNVALTNFLLQD